MLVYRVSQKKWGFINISSSPDFLRQMAQNTKWKPLDEKIFVSSKFLDFDHSRLNFPDCSR